MKVGTKKIARLSRRMGIRTPVSENLAMSLGGLSEGVTPLDLAHAYLAFPNKGKLVYGSLSPGADEYHGGSTTVPGPAGIDSITQRGKGPGDRAARRREGAQRAPQPPGAAGGRGGADLLDPADRGARRDGQARLAGLRHPRGGQDGDDGELLRRPGSSVGARATRSRSGSGIRTASSR